MATSNEALVKELVDAGTLKTNRLIVALKKIDRKDFVSQESRELAYEDEPISIGYGQTISQPTTVAFMLELLNVQPGDFVLDIGAGSGWQTALLAYVAGRAVREISDPIVETNVLALERIPELKEMAEKNVEKYGFISRGVAKVVLADGSKGAPRELMPRYGFNKIIAAAAGDSIPLMWKKQLAVNGIIVAPIGDSIVVLEKFGIDQYRRREYEGFRFVPLVRD